MNRTGKVNSFKHFLFAVFLIASLVLPMRAESQVQEIIVVFKTHFDICYNDLVTNILTRYRTEFVDGATKLIELSQSLPPEHQFVWTVPGWPLKEMLCPGQTPERREKILRAMKEGRLAVNARPVSLPNRAPGFGELGRG